MKEIYLLLAFVLFPFLGKAQNISYKELTSATAYENGQQLLSPFSGGFNATVPAKVDLNRDGKDDLVIYDHLNFVLKTFINVGGIGDEKYEYAPKYAKNFPKIVSYVKFMDYNCDNVPDLFHRGASGVSVHPGYYDNNELKFTFYKELYYPGALGRENCYVQFDDIPIIRDLDGDGDIDVVSFQSGGSRPSFYKNLQVENNYPCDSIIMTFDNPCYGQMWQSIYRYHVLNVSCKGNTSNKRTRHPANCILAIDINNNGLLDWIGGNGTFEDAQILYNGGSPTNAFFTSQDTVFSINGHALELYSWPAPFYFDIDNDNDKDLIFTPHKDYKNTANLNAMAVYENIGTATNTNFVFRNDSALLGSIIDVGRNSHPTLFDYDKDGKLDLFIGNEGYFNTASKTSISRVAYYKNTSVVGTVSFTLVTKDFLNLSTKNYVGLYPTFGDVTGDGVDDLLLGTDDGTIITYENLATTNTAQSNFTWLTDQLQNIDVGDNAFPLVYDFNNDNKLDLLVGNEIGVLGLYLDTSSTIFTKEYKRIDSAVGGIEAGGVNAFLGNAVPYIGRVDSGIKDYLLLGNSEGTIERYDSFVNQLGNWPQIDSQMSKIQTALRSAPAIGDLDGDQRPELLIGNQNGGINIYQYDKYLPNTNVGLNNLDNGTRSISLFPNPGKNEIWIKSQVADALISYEIYDLFGRIVHKETDFQNTNESISISNLTSGTYFIKVSFSDKQTAVARFVKQE